jgi:hypothetical protein
MTKPDTSRLAINGTDLLSLTAMADVQVEPQFDRGEQSIEPAGVGGHMSGGRRFVEECDLPAETPSRPPSFGNIQRKFRNLLAYARGQIPSATLPRWWRKLRGSSGWRMCAI